ncbi:MAG: UDP binding domain-containing protein [Sutterellaceae bacterium]|nr:hypothetical protein [Burkholderiaceae bacterium]MDW8429334.1 UDP binding domain-containing protein [Sutterellaceae bacterium]
MNISMFGLGYVGAVSHACSVREGQRATSTRVAAMGKHSCRNFHARKMTFANETARLGDALGGDSFQVMDLVCRDTESNIARAYRRPGLACGGSCLPIDLRATRSLAKQHDVEAPMHAGILPSNRAHIERAIAKVLETGKRRIGMIGLAFKTGTDDLRESPLVLLAEHLIGKGLSLLVYDPAVHPLTRQGANRKCIGNHISHIGALIGGDQESVIAESQVLVVGLNDKKTVEALRRHARTEQVVIDRVDVGSHGGLHARYVGLCW